MVQQETRVNERLLDISLLRVISIVAVVAFHVYGMMYADHFPKSKDLYHQIYWAWNQCGLINIAMPMFVFVSGYLFAFLMRKGKYPTFGALLKNKIKRLLLPYSYSDLINGRCIIYFFPFWFVCGSLVLVMGNHMVAFKE